MKRLLQLATVVLSLAGLIAPIVEFFDDWDSEGLSDDTEFGVFALIFVLCVALLVCRLISSSSLQFSFKTYRVSRCDGQNEAADTAHGVIFVIPPLYSPPLRI
jgi:hypothetical protein